MSNEALSAGGRPAAGSWFPLEVAAVGMPPLILAIFGLTHPVSLTDDTAEYWRNLHIILLPIFPLLGVGPWLIARRYGRVYGWITAVLGYIYAAFYTSLDVLAGIGAGGLRLDNGGNGRSVLYDLADALVLPGVYAYLAATVLAAALAVIAVRGRAVIPALLVIVAAVSFIDSHIYPPRGVITMAALCIGWVWIAFAIRNRSALGSRP